MLLSESNKLNINLIAISSIIFLGMLVWLFAYHGSFWHYAYHNILDEWFAYNITILWINILLLIICISALFRGYDFYHKSKIEKREVTRVTSFTAIIIVTIIYAILILPFLIASGIYMWKAGGTVFNISDILVLVGKIVIGIIIKILLLIYNAFHSYIAASIQTVDLTFNIAGREFHLNGAEQNFPYIADIATIVVLFMIVRYRKIIGFLLSIISQVTRYIQKILFGGTPWYMKEGLAAKTRRGLWWFKDFVLFILGFDVQGDTSRGSAEFANAYQEASVFEKENIGLTIDGVRRIDKARSYRHITVIAPTGQGKTSNYVIPNLLNTEKGEKKSFVITDPKGDIHKNTSGYLQSIGYDIRVIDLTNPEYSHHFNPLERANTDKEIAKIAEIIIDARFKGEGSNNAFFLNSSKMLLTMLIKIIKRLPKEHQNLHNLLFLLNCMGGTGEGIQNLVLDSTKPIQISREISPEIAERLNRQSKMIRKEFESFATKDPETISNVIFTTQTALKDLAIEEIQILTATDTIQFDVPKDGIREKNTAIFIITPPSEVEFYRFLLTLLYSQIFTYCEVSGLEAERKNTMDSINEIIFLMDEFGNLGRIPSFPQTITTLRSCRCSISLILQDIEQVRMVYGKSGASTIINGGTASKLVFGGIQNLETLQDVSRLMGNQTLKQKGSDGRELSTISRPLMYADEINQMPMGQALFLTSGSRPIKAKLTQWKANDKMKQRGLLPPTKEQKRETSIQYLDYESYTEQAQA